MELKTNTQRLMQTLESLGQIGNGPQGLHRLAFGNEDIQARRYIVTLMEEANLETTVDPAGNLIGRWKGSKPDLPTIAVGSHTDTVPNAGKYDGALGVLGAIECCKTLKDRNIRPRHTIEVINFTNEEGTRYHRWLYGSRAMAGLLDDADITAVDDEDVPIGRRLSSIGGDIEKIALAQRGHGAFSAYLELHIEQGPILYQTDIPIGVVTGITGRLALSVSISGVSNHAGTTPMDRRKDALLSASYITQAVNTIATTDEICRVGTVGVMNVTAAAENVVPGNVYLTAEFRDADKRKLEDANRRLRAICSDLESTTGVTIKITSNGVSNPMPMSQRIQKTINEVSQTLSLETILIPSGAGHDAQSMAAITEAGMIFVPSEDGISHSPEEYSSQLDCSNGTNVLLNSLMEIDEDFD